VGNFAELADNESFGCNVVVVLFSLFFSKQCHHVSNSKFIIHFVHIRFFKLLLISRDVYVELKKSRPIQKTNCLQGHIFYKLNFGRVFIYYEVL
jgi:hypothetical protein